MPLASLLALASSFMVAVKSSAMLLNSATPPFIAIAVSANAPRPAIIATKPIPPEPMIRDPTTAITPSIPTRAINNTDKAPTLDKALSMSLMLAKTHTNSRKTSPNAANDTMPRIAAPAVRLIALRTARTPTMTANSPAIAAAPARAAGTFVTVFARRMIMPANMPITTVKATIDPIGILPVFSPFRLLIIRANTPISNARAPADAARSFILIKDKATTEAAIIAIATAIIMIAPLTF